MAIYPARGIDIATFAAFRKSGHCIATRTLIRGVIVNEMITPDNFQNSGRAASCGLILPCDQNAVRESDVVNEWSNVRLVGSYNRRCHEKTFLRENGILDGQLRYLFTCVISIKCRQTRCITGRISRVEIRKFAGELLAHPTF